MTLLEGHEGPIVAAAFNSDGTLAMTTAHDSTARVWDVGTGNALAVFRGHESPVTSAAFSPDGTQALTASMDKTVRVWRLVTMSRQALIDYARGRVPRKGLTPAEKKRFFLTGG